MGGKKLLVIYEKKNGNVDTKQLVSTLEILQKKEKVEVKDYSFEEFAEKDSVVFWKAIIIFDDPSNVSQKITSITGKFDPEHIGEFRVITESQGSPGTGSEIHPEKVISTTNMADISTWWPRVLYFLFPREHKTGKTFTCLFLFDGNSLLQNTEELRWFQMMNAILKPLGINCLWAGDVERGLVLLTQPNQAENVVVPATGTRPDCVVVLSRNGGEAMFQKAGHHIRRSLKTIVITDDRNSDVCQQIKGALEKAYLFQVDHPLYPDYTGWSVLLRELKIIKCEDVAFVDERNTEKIVMTVLILVLIFVVLPIFLAIVAGIVVLDLMGYDLDRLKAICDCYCPCFDSIDCTSWLEDLDEEPFKDTEEAMKDMKASRKNKRKRKQ